MENANPGKPTGTEGRNMVRRMNDSHAPLREWAFSFLDWDVNSILDCGCGGGAALADMEKLAPDAGLYGIDYSDDCVEVAKENCPNADIILADVSDIPFSDDSFSLITAIETVYFWKEPEKAFKEILRVLEDDGTFAAIFEVDGPGRVGPEAYMYDMTIYSPTQLKDLMKKSGFREVEAHVKGNGYMLAIGKK